MAFGKPLDALKILLLWTRSLLPSCLFHFSVETVLPVAKDQEALPGLGCLVIHRGPDRLSSCFVPSCSVVCLPFYLLYRVRHLLGFTPLCGSLIRHCARGAAFGQTGCPFLPSTVKSQLLYKTLCCICEENQDFLSNSFSPGVFRSEDRIVNKEQG